MKTVDAPMLEALREIHHRLNGVEKAAQTIVTALQGVVNGLHEEKNTLLKLVARAHDIPADRLQVDFLTGEVSRLPDPPQEDRT